MTGMDTVEDAWSVTTEEIHGRLASMLEAGTDAVVATVVDVEGSAYRRPGARMLVTDDEESAGAITAGCLEGPVANLADEVFADGVPRVETFDLMDDDAWGLGLGCNGIIDILLEPLDESWAAALGELEERRPVAMLTGVESSDPGVSVGDRVVIDTEGKTTAAGRPGLPDEVVTQLRDRAGEFRESASSGTIPVETDDGEVRVFVDGVAPAPDLLLFGNQNDIHPVARLARQSGFRVTVASARGARADPDQFPNAHRVEGVRAPDVHEVVEAPDRTYAVLMSHNLTDDALALESLLKESTVPYVGLMGPRERFEEVREEASATGTTFTGGELERVSTPVGLDLGGGEPAQIALSIVGEAMAVANGRDGRRLKDREGPIHRRVDA
jgi:xanthine dehydrogenase accessory factor